MDIGRRSLAACLLLLALLLPSFCGAALPVVEFLGTDRQTQGEWIGSYGRGCYGSYGKGSFLLPNFITAGQDYLQVHTNPKYTVGLRTYETVNAERYTWAPRTDDSRALRSYSGHHVAACYRSQTSFSVTFHFQLVVEGKRYDTAYFDAGVYMVDFDRQGRQQLVEVCDVATGNLLDSRIAESFGDGLWLRYRVRGDCKFTFTGLAGTDAVASGFFFDKWAWIEGYGSDSSVVQGGSINFHISTVGPVYDIFIEEYNNKGQLVPLYSVIGLAGHEYKWSWDSNRNGCNWPVAYTFNVPVTMPSGLYYARLRTQMDPLEPFYIPFVVKEDNPGSTSSILVQWASTTDQAYNLWGSRSYYASLEEGTNALQGDWLVSFNRPYERGFGRAFLHDVAGGFYRMLKQEGITAEFCSSLDIHRDANLLMHYRVLVSAYHDEYWSREMYDHCQQFVDAGGNLLFFGCNTFYWQIRLSSDLKQMTCYKNTRDPVYKTNPSMATILWKYPPLNRPSSRMVGSYTTASGTMLTGVPFGVVDADHWAFRDCGVSNGDQLGKAMVQSEIDATDEFSPPNTQVLMRTLMPIGGGKTAYCEATYFERTPEYGFPSWTSAKSYCGSSLAYCLALDNLRQDREYDPRVVQMTKNLLTVFSIEDRIPPAAIRDLRVVMNAMRPVKLIWTAPGDDADRGLAQEYEVRVSYEPVTELNWRQATIVEPAPVPSAPGSTEVMILNLPAGPKPYFAVRTKDKALNSSLLSNVPTGTWADVNGDGCINVTDLLLVRNAMGHTGTSIVPPSADVNGDGIVNISDLLAIRNMLGAGCE